MEFIYLESALKERWDANEASAKALADDKAITGERREKLEREIQHERTEMEKEFEAIVRRRKNEQELEKLTDWTHVAPLFQEFLEANAFAKFSFKWSLAELEPSNKKRFSWYWRVQFYLAEDKPTEQEQRRWQKFIEQVNEVVMRDHPEFIENDGDKGSGVIASWTVNTMVWEGPPRIRQQMQLNWEKP